MWIRCWTRRLLWPQEFSVTPVILLPQTNGELKIALGLFLASPVAPVEFLIFRGRLCPLLIDSRAA